MDAIEIFLVGMIVGYVLGMLFDEVVLSRLSHQWALHVRASRGR